MSQNDIPIFCINLSRATERKKLIQENWIDKLGLDIKFFDAFDRREIEEKNHYVYQYLPKKAILKIKRPLSIGEIACSTSWALLTKQILDSNINEVIMMEDDILPLFASKDYFFEVINKAKEEFPQVEVAICHKPLEMWLWHAKSDHVNFYEKKQYFSLLKNAPWGNHLVYMNKSGLEKFYTNLIKMEYPADWIWNDVFTKDKTIIYCNNPLGYHDNTENSTTYIGNEYRGIMRKFIK